MGETGLLELDLALGTYLLEFEQECQELAVPASELLRLKDETLRLRHGCQLGLYYCRRWQRGMHCPLPSQPYTEGVCGRLCYVDLPLGLRHTLCRIHAGSVFSCLCCSLAEHKRHALQCYSHLNPSYRW